MEKAFNLEFDNLIMDNNFDELPDYRGIYLFRVTIRKEDGLHPNIVYIGMADGDMGLRGRVTENHEHLNDARLMVEKEIAKGNDAILTISYSKKNVENEKFLDRIEAALIYARQPSINDKCKDSFKYQTTILNISGRRMSDLKKKYTVETTK